MFIFCATLRIVTIGDFWLKTVVLKILSKPHNITKLITTKRTTAETATTKMITTKPTTTKITTREKKYFFGSLVLVPFSAYVERLCRLPYAEFLNSFELLEY